MALEKNHDLPDLFLLSPGSADPFVSDRADAFNLKEAFRPLLDQVEGLYAEHLHNSLCHHRADAPDQSGAQVLLYPGQCGGKNGEAA